VFLSRANHPTQTGRPAADMTRQNETVERTTDVQRHRGRSAAFVAATVLLFACGRAPADDAILLLRQRSLGTTMEVKVDDAQLSVTVMVKTTVHQRTSISISPQDSAKIRSLFWEAFCNQPTHTLHPVRDLVFEQEWRGRARIQTVVIQGYPLPSRDRRAYDFLNRFLPPGQRFLVDAGPYGRTTAD
jgi:hypothetical protein